MSKDSHSFSVSVACEVGVPGAILLQHLCFLQKANVSPGENWQEKWVRRSAASIAKTYPYWSAKQVSAICDNLEKQGYIFSRIQNATKIDRAKSYLLSSKGLHLMGEIPFAQMENGFSKKGNANAQMENDILPNGEMLIKVNCTSSLVPSFVENNAGASAPLSPPFKKVDEIEPLEAEKEKDFNTGAGGGAPTIVKLYDNQLPGVVVIDSIPPQPMTKPETTGRQRQTRNTPHIHPENETCFSYFSDPAKARAAWQEWIDYKYEQHRERYKAAKSELSKLRQLFKQFSGDSEKFEVAVNYSIGNLYKGVFPPKQEKENGQFQHLDKAQQQHLKLARFVADLRTGAAFADTRKVEYITGEKPV